MHGSAIWLSPGKRTANEAPSKTSLAKTRNRLNRTLPIHEPSARPLNPSRLHDSTRHRVRQRPTLPASPPRLILCKLHHGGLDLRPKIRTVERAFMHHFATNLAVPAQAVKAAVGAGLLEHDADGGGEADGVVWRVGWQKEHFALADGNVAEDGLGAVDDFEQHAATVLVEPFWGRVDVVVCAGVWAPDDLLRGLVVLAEREIGHVRFYSDAFERGEARLRDRNNALGDPDHDCDTFVIYAVVVYRGLQEVGILFKPESCILSMFKLPGRSKATHLGKVIHTILVDSRGMKASFIYGK